MIQLETIKPYIKNKAFVISTLEGRGYKFNRAGLFRLRDERTPSASIRRDGYIKDFGGDFSGDLIDYFEKKESMSKSEAINYIGYLVGLTDSIDTKIKPLNIPKPKQESNISDSELISKLNYEAKHYLRIEVPVIGSLDELPCKERIKKKIEVRALEVYKDDGKIDTFTVIPSVFEKLFEGIYLNTKPEYLDYIFNHIVGYSHFFNCPVIILKDINFNVVDVAYYRPISSDGKELPKYLYKPNSKKPYKRGSFFLYPFQKEMEIIISKKPFAIVGEGLKNAVNALAYKIPYISLEGAGNRPSDKLINYIKELENKGKRVFTAFDGDNAGKKTHSTFNELMQRDYENLFAFDSNEDFVTFVKKSFLGG